MHFFWKGELDILSPFGHLVIISMFSCFCVCLCVFPPFAFFCRVSSFACPLVAVNLLSYLSQICPRQRACWSLCFYMHMFTIVSVSLQSMLVRFAHLFVISKFLVLGCIYLCSVCPSLFTIKTEINIWLLWRQYLEIKKGDKTVKRNTPYQAITGMTLKTVLVYWSWMNSRS